MSISPCPSPTPQPVRGIVVFEPAVFKVQYPMFATVADGLLQGDFDIATMFLNNSCCSVVKDAAVRERLLYLLVAHIAALLQGQNGKPPSGLVGRIDKASEGTVSISASYITEMSMSEAYFSQTPFGVMFWMATVGYRSFHYIPAPANACIGRGPGFLFPGYPGSGNCC